MASSTKQRVILIVVLLAVVNGFVLWKVFGSTDKKVVAWLNRVPEYYEVDDFGKGFRFAPPANRPGFDRDAWAAEIENFDDEAWKAEGNAIDGVEETLIQFLRTADPRVDQWDVIFAMQVLARPAFVEDLIALADSPDPVVRYRVFTALAAINDSRAIETFLNAATNDSHEFLRGATLVMLSEFKDERAPSELVWYELTPQKDGPPKATLHVVDDQSGVGAQFVTTDVDGDGRQDIVVSNRKGVFLFRQKKEAK